MWLFLCVDYLMAFCEKLTVHWWHSVKIDCWFGKLLGISGVLYRHFLRRGTKHPGHDNQWSVRDSKWTLSEMKCSALPPHVLTLAFTASAGLYNGTNLLCSWPAVWSVLSWKKEINPFRTSFDEGVSRNGVQVIMFLLISFWSYTI